MRRSPNSRRLRIGDAEYEVPSGTILVVDARNYLALDAWTVPVEPDARSTNRALAESVLAWALSNTTDPDIHDCLSEAVREFTRRAV